MPDLCSTRAYRPADGGAAMNHAALGVVTALVLLSPAVHAPVASADNYPARKPGLWERGTP